MEITSRLRAVSCAVVAGLAVCGTTLGFTATAHGSSTGVTTAQAAGISPGAGILSLSSANLTTTLNGIAASGAKWLRVDVDWPAVESTQGSFNWTTPDRVITAALADGLNVDALLSYVPSWAKDASTGFPNATYFGQFAIAAAQHYAPLGVHTFEIWNEPNLARNWGPTVSPSSYTQLLVSGYNAIKTADPGSFVVSGGLSPATDATDGSQMSPATFLTDMYAAGAGGHMDAVGIHPYSFPYDPMTPGSWNTFYDMPTYHQTMVNNGDGSKQIWATEFGVPTCTNSSNCVSLSTQATQMSEAFNQIKQWAWAGPIFYYNWQDGTDASTNLYDSFGLVDAAFTAKSALTSFENGAALLSGTATTTTATTTSTTTAPTTTSTSLLTTVSTLATAVTAPVDTLLPVISGIAKQGSTLTASTGTWSGSPASYGYQWQRCSSSGCGPVSGATTSSYLIGSGDVGYTLAVTVTASNSAGSSSATSAPTAVVVSNPFTTSKPKSTHTKK